MKVRSPKSNDNRRAAPDKVSGFDSDSSSEHATSKITPAPTAQKGLVKYPSPAANKKKGALKLDWLSNLEEEMGQLQGQIEKLSPHVRGRGVESPSVQGRNSDVGTPSSAGNGIQFFKKNDRPAVRAASPKGISVDEKAERRGQSELLAKVFLIAIPPNLYANYSIYTQTEP